MGAALAIKMAHHKHFTGAAFVSIREIQLLCKRLVASFGSFLRNGLLINVNKFTRNLKINLSEVSENNTSPTQNFFKKTN